MSNVIDLTDFQNGNTEQVLTYNGESVSAKLEEVIIFLNVCIRDQPLVERDMTKFDLDLIGPLWTENYDLMRFINSLEPNEVVWEEKVFLCGEVTALFNPDEDDKEHIMELLERHQLYGSHFEKLLGAQIKSIPSVFKKLQRCRKQVAK